MYGDVEVSIIFLESNGVIDENKEDWTASERNAVLKEISDGLIWWTRNKDDNVKLRFHIENKNLHMIETDYEPITRPQSDEGLWINDAMDYLGIDSGIYFFRVEDYD